MSESRPRLWVSAAATWFLTLRLDAEAQKATAGMGSSGLLWWSPVAMLILILSVTMTIVAWLVGREYARRTGSSPLPVGDGGLVRGRLRTVLFQSPVAA